jgi:hypothetical protein
LLYTLKCEWISIIDGDKKWITWMIFQESIIHIKKWPFTQLPVKREKSLRKMIIRKLVWEYSKAEKNIYPRIAWCLLKRRPLSQYHTVN